MGSVASHARSGPETGVWGKWIAPRVNLRLARELSESGRSPEPSIVLWTG